MAQSTSYQTIEYISNSHNESGESGNVDARHSSDSTAPLLRSSKQEWKSQKELEAPRHRLLGSIAAGGLSVAFGLAFAVLGIVPLILRDRASDPATCGAFLEAFRISTTAWPIVFGLVVGGAFCSAALYLGSSKPSRLSVQDFHESELAAANLQIDLGKTLRLSKCRDSTEGILVIWPS